MVILTTRLLIINTYGKVFQNYLNNYQLTGSYVKKTYVSARFDQILSTFIQH